MTIAIIGAGISGLAAAYQLRNNDDLVIFEKSRGYGGRAATRWHDLPDGQRVYIDHGAQYIKDDSPAIHSLIKEVLSSEDLVDIERPVWVFDRNSQISEGDPKQNQGPKWTYRKGLASFGKRIVEAGQLDVRLNTRIVRLDYDPEGQDFTLYDEAGTALTTAQQVLLTIPAGQAVELLQASQIPTDERETLIGALNVAQYRRCITIALGYSNAQIERPYYALINSDRGSALSWLAFEHMKPGHVPPAHSVLVAQMAGPYSAENWDRAKEQVTAEVAEMVSALLREELRQPDWTEYHKWRYALPDQTVQVNALNGVLKGLWFAGDWTRTGRVHQAAQSGFDVAVEIKNAMDQR